jgi:hypothetical protein
MNQIRSTSCWSPSNRGDGVVNQSYSLPMASRGDDTDRLPRGTGNVCVGKSIDHIAHDGHTVSEGGQAEKHKGPSKYEHEQYTSKNVSHPRLHWSKMKFRNLRPYEPIPRGSTVPSGPAEKVERYPRSTRKRTLVICWKGCGSVRWVH